jgi:hypothetical protein
MQQGVVVIRGPPAVGVQAEETVALVGAFEEKAPMITQQQAGPPPEGGIDRM